MSKFKINNIIDAAHTLNRNPHLGLINILEYAGMGEVRASEAQTQSRDKKLVIATIERDDEGNMVLNVP